LISGLQYACPLANQSALANQMCSTIDTLLRTPDHYKIHQQVLALHTNISQSQTADPAFSNIVSRLNADVDNLISTQKRLSVRAWFPVLRWHGAGNQYHQWMSGFLTLKPLTSLVDGRNAWTKILGALGWTLWLNGLAFILAILCGIAIGIWSGTHDGHLIERIINVVLFALFALPSFWLATLFIIFLSSGEWLSIFPTGGLGAYHNANHVFEKWSVLLHHLTLPVLCLALGSLAYVSRQMKQSVVFQLSQPYVMALRTQGISEKTIVRQHVIKNAFFPLITLIGGSLPALLSGSLIIEVIFSIPGMGRLMYTSLLARDWPVVFPILMFGAAITVIAYILTDIVYKWADPRVKSMGS
jgi:peptide/nickel transport system permease protein